MFNARTPSLLAVWEGRAAHTHQEEASGEGLALEVLYGAGQHVHLGQELDVLSGVKNKTKKNA